MIYEVSGAPPALQTAVQAAAREATIVVASFYGDRTVPLVLSPEFHTRRVRVVSTMVGGINPALQPRWDFARRTQTALALLPTLKTDRLLSRRVAMVDAAEAFDALDRNPDDNLGIILTY